MIQYGTGLVPLPIIPKVTTVYASHRLDRNQPQLGNVLLLHLEKKNGTFWEVRDVEILIQFTPSRIHWSVLELGIVKNKQLTNYKKTAKHSI